MPRRVRNPSKKPQVRLEHAPAPDAEERLGRAYALVLKTAARAKEEVKPSRHGDDANKEGEQ